MIYRMLMTAAPLLLSLRAVPAHAQRAPQAPAAATSSSAPRAAPGPRLLMPTFPKTKPPALCCLRRLTSFDSTNSLPVQSRPSPRGPVIRRGLFWGALAGGTLGYFLGRHEDYGGAVYGAVYGAVIGAPIGMFAFLLATP